MAITKEMEKMITELRKDQNNFEIMSDQEYLDSGRFKSRKNRNSKREYIHCLIPGNEHNTLAIYFDSNSRIRVVDPCRCLDKFNTNINIERRTKDYFNRPYDEFLINKNDYNDIYKDTKDLVLEMLSFIHKKHLDHV